MLHSSLARRLPVPDASLGALAHAAEAVTAAAGGRDRWRSSPWLVLVYGATALALGVAGTLLTMLQAVVFDAWCTLCVASAAISVNAVGPALGEVLATLQMLAREHARGHRLSDSRRGEPERNRSAPSA